jgi:predicted transcriptional regulator
MAEPTPIKLGEEELLRLTAELVAAYVRNHTLSSNQLPDVINSIYGSLKTVESKSAIQSMPLKPAVPIKKSITADYLICLEDGKKLKMLKRHLRSAYNLTPDAYRKKWSLPLDYPMVAPNYAHVRSVFAKKIGLGRSGGRGGAKRAAPKK